MYVIPGVCYIRSTAKHVGARRRATRLSGCACLPCDGRVLALAGGCAAQPAEQHLVAPCTQERLDNDLGIAWAGAQGATACQRRTCRWRARPPGVPAWAGASVRAALCRCGFVHSASARLSHSLPAPRSSPAARSGCVRLSESAACGAGPLAGPAGAAEVRASRSAAPCACHCRRPAPPPALLPPQPAACRRLVHSHHPCWLAPPMPPPAASGMLPPPAFTSSVLGSTAHAARRTRGGWLRRTCSSTLAAAYPGCRAWRYGTTLSAGKPAAAAMPRPLSRHALTCGRRWALAGRRTCVPRLWMPPRGGSPPAPS